MAHDGSVTIGINGDDSGFKSALSKLGSVTSAALKGVAVAATAATTAIVAVGKQAIEAYASYEQLVGGIETLFKGSADIVQKYAADAYKTAGLSANDYMETVTSFSASLLQSVGGDTAEAARIADMAITDMADNANKMGTSMESIQYAYQGFAKQNYTMLDNLKLGYGGTQKEMQRLLEDATALSGIEYNISDLNDVYEAIHVIQTELGITGTTSREAATTIQGSVSMMEAAWQNLLVGMADETQDFDQLLTNFLESVGTVGENLIPRMEVVLGGVVKLVSGLGPKIAEALPGLVDSVLPELLAGVDALMSSVAEMVPGLISTVAAVVAEQAPLLIQSALDLLVYLGDALVGSIDVLSGAAMQIVEQLGIWLTEYSYVLINNAAELLIELAQALTAPAGLNTLLTAAVDIIMALADGLLSAAPQIIAAAPEIIGNLVSALTGNDNLGMLIDASIELILAIVDALIDNLDELAAAAVEIVVALADGLIDAIPRLLVAAGELALELLDKIMETDWLELGADILEKIIDGLNSVKNSLSQTASSICSAIDEKLSRFEWYQKGREVLEKIVNGIRSWFANLSSTARELVEQVKQAITNTDWWSVGSNIISGIANGISGAVGNLISAARNAAVSALNTIKGALGIASPSKVMDEEVGQMIPPGIGRGVQKALPKLSAEMRRELEGLIEDANISVAAEVGTVSRQISGTSGGGGFPAEPRPAASGGGLTMNVYVTTDASQTPSQARSVGREIGAEAARAIRRKGITIV